MTERELRELMADTALEYLGCNEAEGTHRPIIDLYNQIRPLPRGYRMSYYDPWCAAFISAIAQETGLTDIVFPECGCDAMINLYRAAGRWREADDYNPEVGDIVMYDWEDNGIGDNTGSADHVGLVYAKNGSGMTIIEGNISDSVDFRPLNRNGRNVRGYCCPDYAGAAARLSGGEAAEVITPAGGKESAEGGAVSVKLPVLRKGSVGVTVGAMQALIMYFGYSVGIDGADGDFGSNTLTGLRQFQRDRGLENDGVCGIDTWTKLLGL